MKNYIVEVFSDKVNMRGEFADLSEAYDKYFKSMYAGRYERGHLMDAHTGEILARFSWEESHGNWDIQQYFSSVFIPEVRKNEIVFRSKRKRFGA
jgi:hypothetical protein